MDRTVGGLRTCPEWESAFSTLMGAAGHSTIAYYVALKQSNADEVRQAVLSVCDPGGETK
jgi:hypothetical protein